jgi:hypothetical protein
MFIQSVPDSPTSLTYVLHTTFLAIDAVDDVTDLACDQFMVWQVEYFVSHACSVTGDFVTFLDFWAICASLADGWSDLLPFYGGGRWWVVYLCSDQNVSEVSGSSIAHYVLVGEVWCTVCAILDDVPVSE